MTFKIRMLQGATALLYLGPLLAGMGRADLRLIAAFAAIFVLWLYVLRPHQWPRSLEGWRQGGGLVRILSQTAVQVLLVALLFGLGRGIGGVVGLEGVWPVSLPLAISFLSIPLARLVWDPWRADETAAFLDTAIAAIERESKAGTRPDFVDEMLAPMLDLTQGTPDGQIMRHLDLICRHVPVRDLWDGLVVAADGADARGRRAARAAILFATSPRYLSSDGRDLAARCLTQLPTEAELFDLFLERAERALQQSPDLVGAFPTEALLRSVLRELGGGSAAARAAVDRLALQMREAGALA